MNQLAKRKRIFAKAFCLVAFLVISFLPFFNNTNTVEAYVTQVSDSSYHVFNIDGEKLAEVQITTFNPTPTLLPPEALALLNGNSETGNHQTPDANYILLGTTNGVRMMKINYESNNYATGRIITNKTTSDGQLVSALIYPPTILSPAITDATLILAGKPNFGNPDDTKDNTEENKKQAAAAAASTAGLKGPSGAGLSVCWPTINPANATIVGRVVNYASGNDTRVVQTIDGNACAAALFNFFLELLNVPFIISALFFDFMIQFTVNNFGAYFNGAEIGKVGSSLSGPVDTVWRLLRNFSNIIFIFALLYIAIKTMLEATGSFDKTLLKNVIIAAILINFSLLFTKLIIDASNYTSLVIYNQIKTSIGNQNITVNGATSTGATQPIPASANINFSTNGFKVADAKLAAAYIGGMQLQKMQTGDKFSINPGNMAVHAFMAIIMMIVSTSVFFIMALVFMYRFIILVILMMTSPLAFSGSLFPEMKSKVSDRWWKTLKEMSIFAPVFMIMVYISLQLMTFTQKVTSNSGEGLAGFNPLAIIVAFSITIASMVMCLVVAKGAGAGASGYSFASKWGGKIAGGLTTGVAARVGRRTIGRASNAALNSQWVKNRVAGGGILGKIAYGTLKTGANASYDARNTGVGKAVSEQVNLGEGGGKGGYSAVLKDQAKKVDERLKFISESSPKIQEASVLHNAQEQAKEREERAKTEMDVAEKGKEEFNKERKEAVESVAKLGLELARMDPAIVGADKIKEAEKKLEDEKKRLKEIDDRGLEEGGVKWAEENLARTTTRVNVENEELNKRLSDDSHAEAVVTGELAKAKVSLDTDIKNLEQSLSTAKLKSSLTGEEGDRARAEAKRVETELDKKRKELDAVNKSSTGTELKAKIESEKGRWTKLVESNIKAIEKAKEQDSKTKENLSKKQDAYSERKIEKEKVEKSVEAFKANNPGTSDLKAFVRAGKKAEFERKQKYLEYLSTGGGMLDNAMGFVSGANSKVLYEKYLEEMKKQYRSKEEREKDDFQEYIRKEAKKAREEEKKSEDSKPEKPKAPEETK